MVNYFNLIHKISQELGHDKACAARILDVAYHYESGVDVKRD